MSDAGSLEAESLILWCLARPLEQWDSGALQVGYIMGIPSGLEQPTGHPR